jgi:uncharacterized FlaG/YvyC family protein
VQGYAPQIAVQSDPNATELPAAKAVTPAAATQTARNDAQSQSTTHEVIIDPQTREVIYRVIDVRSRQVVRQVPDEALLRVRAYAAALAKGTSPSKAQYQADLEV